MRCAKRGWALRPPRHAEVHGRPRVKSTKHGPAVRVRGDPLDNEIEQQARLIRGLMATLDDRNDAAQDESVLRCWPRRVSLTVYVATLGSGDHGRRAGAHGTRRAVVCINLCQRDQDYSTSSGTCSRICGIYANAFDSCTVWNCLTAGGRSFYGRSGC